VWSNGKTTTAQDKNDDTNEHDKKACAESGHEALFLIGEHWLAVVIN
jgi:hypothetical protein